MWCVGIMRACRWLKRLAFGMRGRRDGGGGGRVIRARSKQFGIGEFGISGLE